MADIKQLLDDQKKEYLDQIKAEILAMKTSLAAELRTELRDFIQTEIAKSTPIPDSKRKQAKTTDDMETDGFSTPVGASSSASPAATRTVFRPAGPAPALRPPRAGSAPPGRQASSAAEDDEHLVRIKLPEPVHEKFVRPWWDSVVARLPGGLAPIDVTIRPFHDFLALFYSDKLTANSSAVALRGLELKLTTCAGPEKHIVVIRDRPPLVQRRGRGIHPFYELLLKEALQDGEEIKPLHRARGKAPYSIFHAVNPISGAARMLLTLQWSDSDPDAHAIRITEVIPDEALTPQLRDRLRALRSP